MFTRTKFHVEYPVAKTINEAIKFMKQGGAVWQECSDDFPDCMGFDDIDCLKENFPEEDWDYDADEQSLFLHLVPANADEDVPAPLRVGETVWVAEDFLDTEYWNESLRKGNSFKVTEVKNGKIKIDNKHLAYHWFNPNDFTRCILAEKSEKAYILFDLEETSFFGFCESFTVFHDLEHLKIHCGENVIWDYDEMEEKFDEVESGNWLYSGWDAKTGKLLYGVESTEILTQYAT
jgi:hypothetical protein